MHMVHQALILLNNTHKCTCHGKKNWCSLYFLILTDRPSNFLPTNNLITLGKEPAKPIDIFVPYFEI